MFDLLSAGIGLIGSLFGGGSETTTKEESESTSTSSIDYKAMVDAATAAGFNPLTAIRTGGASGFVTTNTKSKGTSTSNSSSGPDFGGIASSVGNIAGALMGGMNNAADPIGSKSGKLGRGLSTAMADSKVRTAQKRPAGSLYSAGQTIGAKVSSNAPSLKTQSKASPAKSKFFGPPTPEQWATANKVAPLYVPYFDRFSNKIVYGANPDGPDFDQLAVPTALNATNRLPPATPMVNDVADYVHTGWSRTMSQEPLKISPATAKQIEDANKSWHRGYLPSFGLRWN